MWLAKLRRVLVALLALTFWVSACQLSTRPQGMGLAALEEAPPATHLDVRRLTVWNPPALRQLCTPLGPRLGLLQIRSLAEWRRVARAIGCTEEAPDLREGMVVGLACWAGTPADGRWPVHIEQVRVRAGAGLLRGSFASGTYLPDGTACLETVHVPGLSTILAVDVDGTRFYPN